MKNLDELSLQFRTVWEVYIKWYTVFLTTNVVALAAVVQYVKAENRFLIVVAFSIQNVLALITAVSIGAFSTRTARRAEALIHALAKMRAKPGGAQDLPPELAESAIPGGLGFWSGCANALGNATLVACWVGLLYFRPVADDKPSAGSTNPTQQSSVAVAPIAPIPSAATNSTGSGR